MKPYKPTPYKDGCHSQVLYTEPFEDRIGNKAEITYCDFTNKKGKRIERHVMFVKWEN